MQQTILALEPRLYRRSGRCRHSPDYDANRLTQGQLRGREPCGHLEIRCWTEGSDNDWCF
jgi:hypothetical protein